MIRNKSTGIENLLISFNKDKTKKIVYDLILGFLSFVIPFSMLLVLFASNGFAPFTKNGLTIISMDMQSQYVAFMRDLKNIYLGNGSLIYTQGKVFGGDYLSIYTFYLASPFNYFVIFCPDESIPLFFLFTSILKIAFTGLNFYLMLRFINKERRLGNLIFAISYSFISYSFIYMSNFMWLDGVMILPLVILGIHLLIEGKHYWLYPLTIFYSLMTSWYIGFIICLFVFTYIIYIYFSKPGNLKEKNPFLIKLCVFSLVGGLLASVYWMTAFLHFSGTKASQSFPYFRFYSLSMLFTGFLENNYTTVGVIQQYHGYISMFVGVVCLVFFLKFFMNPHYSLQERMGTIIFLLFYVLVIENSILNALFHGGREPTWFPGRYSFVIGFLTVFFASKEYNHSKEDLKLSFLPPLIAPIIVLPIVMLTDNSNYSTSALEFLRYKLSVPSLVIYIITLILSSIYPFVRDYRVISDNRQTYKALLSLSLIPLACLSCYRGAFNVVKTNVNQNQYQSMEKYKEDDDLTYIFDNIKEYDNSKNYRMEATFNRPGNYNQIDNNPMFFSYNGLSHFSSSAKKHVEEFLEKLGFQYNGFFEKYDGGSTSAINSLLNIKYVIDDKSTTTNKPQFIKNDNELNSWKEISELHDENSEITYYENKKALPYAFIMDDTKYSYMGDGERIDDDFTYWYDFFEFQNNYFKKLTHDVKDSDGKEKDIFIPIELQPLHSAGVSVTTDKYGVKRYTASAGTTLNFTFTVPEEAYGMNLYFDDKNATKYYSYFVDGVYYENSTYWHEGVRSFKDNESHSHTLRIRLKNEIKNVELRPNVVYEDLVTLNRYLDILKDRSASDLQEKKSLFSYSYQGTINISEENKDKTLLFTFPNETGVSIKIDGKKQKTVTRGNIFAAVDFSSLSVGKHKISFTYTDKGLIIGAVFSSLSLASLVLLVIYYDRLIVYLHERIVRYKKSHRK